MQSLRKNMLLYKKLRTFWISFDGIFFSEISIDDSILSRPGDAYLRQYNMSP